MLYIVDNDETTNLTNKICNLLISHKLSISAVTYFSMPIPWTTEVCEDGMVLTGL